MSAQRILISVYNISGYLMAEVRALVDRGVQVTIIERPCSLSTAAHAKHPEIKWLNRESYPTEQDLFKAIGDSLPDIYLCCGWDDRRCRRLARSLRRKGTTTVVGVDTPWEGRMRQYVHCLYSRFYLTRTFDVGWGAGTPQVKYLKCLGFGKNRRAVGFYSADTQKFATLARQTRNSWPHTFLFVGRFVSYKKVVEIGRAFIKALDLLPQSDWKMRFIGDGPLWNARVQHPRIEYLGYKSPEEIQEYVDDAGVFVLPSQGEHWGVVVHEFAAMGLPLLCSKSVCATSMFLRQSKNGFLFEPQDEDSMVDGLVKMMRLPDAELSAMGQRSRVLGLSYTPENWAEKLLSFRRISR